VPLPGFAAPRSITLRASARASAVGSNHAGLPTEVLEFGQAVSAREIDDYQSRRVVIIVRSR
jgi:hypothetical protein